MHILASGSSGNAILVDNGQESILLDAGLSALELTRRFEAVGSPLDRLRGIVISHEHTDHVQGAPVLARRLRLPIFVNRLTLEHAGRRLAGHALFEFFESGETIPFGSLGVTTFSVDHDAADPVGFVVCSNRWRVGVVTDVGHVTRELEKHLMFCHTLVIEANHDLEMLDSGPYPPELKRRIRGNRGHLSNLQCADLLSTVCHPGLAHVVLAHVSETNNTPHLAHATADRVLPTEDRPQLAVAGPGAPVSVTLTAHGRHAQP